MTIADYIVTGDALIPPTLAEARRALTDRVNHVVRQFISESIQMTAVGLSQIQAGNFVTLDALRQEVEDI